MQFGGITWPGSLLATAALLAAGSSAAPPPAARPAAPEIRAGDYRLVLEKLTQSENVVLEFDDQGRASTSARLNLNLQVAVHSRLPQQRLNLDGLDSRVLAFSQAGRPVSFQMYRLEDAEAARSGIWRALLMAQDADPDLVRLEKLQGQLVVYPRAAVTTLDFPLTAKLPLKLQQGDLTAVLKELKRDGERVSATLEVEWPAGARVSRPNPELPYGISLRTAQGGPVAPSGGSSSVLPGKEGLGMRYSASFSEVREPASAVRLELIVRSGTPAKIPFQFPTLTLPDSLGLVEDALDEAVPILLPGHPLYAATGGELSVVLPRRVAGVGPVLIGLASAASGGERSWRWVEADPNREGRVSLTHLRPGSYRVRWARPPAAGAGKTGPASPPIEARVVAGQLSTVTLPDGLPAGRGGS